MMIQTSELKKLEEVYGQSGNQIVLLYGRDNRLGVGKGWAVIKCRKLQLTCTFSGYTVTINVTKMLEKFTKKRINGIVGSEI